jgi:hypothetical protein
MLLGACGKSATIKQVKDMLRVTSIVALEGIVI